MDALDIVSRDSAKVWLGVDATDTRWDTHIDRVIRSAVDRIERYTCWRLYERTEVVYNRQVPFYNPSNNFPPIGSGEWTGTSGLRSVPGGLSIYLYPFTIISVKDADNADVVYTTYLNPLKTLLYAAPNSVITLQTGFVIANVTQIPQIFLDAIYKLVTDMFENRDNYKSDNPTEVQSMLNQYRRAIL